MSEQKKELLALATQKSLILRQAYKFDPLLWLKEQVKTKDELDAESPVKPFPIQPYTQVLIKEFYENQVLLLAKSRQMQATWLFSALTLHTLQFFDFRLALLISKKEKDAISLVDDRVKFIYARQSEWLKRLCPMARQMRDQPMGQFYLMNGSKAVGMPQGADQPRMYSPSLVLMDEASFQDQFEETYAACAPAIFGHGKSKGKIIAFSSINPGAFARMCDLENTMKSFEEPVKGVQLARNSDGHRVIRLHYSADPEKNPETWEGAEWFRGATSVIDGGARSLKWRREMEIDPEAGSGELVFPNLTEKEDGILINPYEPDDTCSFFGGFDWGTRNPVSFHVYVLRKDGIIDSIWEYYAERKGLPDVAEAIRKCPYYDRLERISADPSMWTENQATPKTNSGHTSIARMFYEDLPEYLRIDKLQPGHIRSDMRFIQKLSVLWQAPPYRFRISRACPRQWNEFKNLKYPARLETVNDAEKILDKSNHAWDDAKYAILSHPSMKTTETKPQWNTMQHHNDAYEAAKEIALETGRDVQEIFNEIFNDYAA